MRSFYSTYRLEEEQNGIEIDEADTLHRVIINKGEQDVCTRTDASDKPADGMKIHFLFCVQYLERIGRCNKTLDTLFILQDNCM